MPKEIKLPINIPNIIYKEEKIIFDNYLLHDSQNAKGDFKKYVEQFIRTNGNPVAPDKMTVPTVYNNKERFQRNNWIYNSNNYRIDNHNNDSILTYYLGNPECKLNYEKIKTMNTLHPDWNHQNNQGNAAIHFIASRGFSYFLDKMIVDFPLNLNLKNKNQDYYTFLLLQPSDKRFDYSFSLYQLEWNWWTLPKPSSKKFDAIFIEKHFKNNPQHFEKASMEKLLELKTNLELIKDINFNRIKYNKNNQTQSLTDKQISQQIIADFKGIDDILHFHYLKKVTVKKQQEIKTKKNKI